MGDLTDAEFREATERGRIFRETHPHAKAARYDATSRRVIVDLINGATFAFPPSLVEGLTDASDTDLAEIEVIAAGYGLHWERLDVDYTVPGLLNGVFGTAKWMAARAGRGTSQAKAVAARANGAKGGRPRKVG